MADGSDQSEAVWNGPFARTVRRSLIGAKVSLVLVGTTGAGKSTLVNTLLIKPVCKEGTSSHSVTRQMQPECLRLEVDGGACTVEVVDTVGYIGRKKFDEKRDEELKTVKSFDLLLLCSDISSNGGRYTTDIWAHIKRFREKGVFTEEMLKTRTVIVLTKANKLVAESGETVKEMIDGWREEHRETLSEEDGEAFLDMPVFMAGRYVFDKHGKPDDKIPIDGSTRWFDDLWNGIGERTDTALPALLFMRAAEVARDPQVKERCRRGVPVLRGSFFMRLVQCLTFSAMLTLPAGVRDRFTAAAQDYLPFLRSMNAMLAAGEDL